MTFQEKSTIKTGDKVVIRFDGHRFDGCGAVVRAVGDTLVSAYIPSADFITIVKYEHLELGEKEKLQLP